MKQLNIYNKAKASNAFANEMKHAKRFLLIGTLYLAAILMWNACSNSNSNANPLKTALLSENWQAVYDYCYMNDSLLLEPETAALLGHAAIMLNKNNESYMLFQYLNYDTTRVNGWLQWAIDFQKQHPGKAAANYFLGDAMMRTQKTSEAIKYFNRSLEIAPDFSIAFNARGFYYGLNRENEKALNDLNASLKTAPGIAEFYITRATLKYLNKSPEGALEDFDKALSISPLSALALNGKACAMAFSTNTGLTPENELDTISHYLSQASFLLHDQVFQSNIRNLTLDIENRIYPELKNDPLFRVSDFLDWNGLKAISDQNENDILRLITKAPLPDFINEDFLIAINLSLFDSDLFKSILKSSQLSESERKIIIDNSNEDDEIQSNNRIILEKLYEGFIAKSYLRDPGMYVAAKTSSTKPNKPAYASAYDAGQMMYDGFKGARQHENEIAGVFGAVAGPKAAAGYKLASSAVGNVGQVAGLVLQIGAANQGIKHNENQIAALKANYPDAYNQAKAAGKTPDPGGALADIKRSSIDGDGPYFLICPNGMGYEKN